MSRIGFCLLALGALSSSGCTDVDVEVANGETCSMPASAPFQENPEVLAAREACQFTPEDPIEDSLGIAESCPPGSDTCVSRAAIAQKIQHVVIVMQENRSFDHMLGDLAASHPDVDSYVQTDEGLRVRAADGALRTYFNFDRSGAMVSPSVLSDSCLEGDPPHQWNDMHAQWNGGRMDGFVRRAAVTESNGHYVMGFYDEDTLPFYYWLANNFAISDRYFGSVLSGTWSNRAFLYAATSLGMKNNTLPEGREFDSTIFHALETNGVSWGVYSGVGDGPSRALARQESIGWDRHDERLHTFQEFLDLLERKGCDDEGGFDESCPALPAVTFVDPSVGEDEHPGWEAPVHNGEKWAHEIYTTAVNSPYWSSMAMFYTYDESGGFADHVPPPPACPPSDEEWDVDFDRLGMRVPVFLVSPYARPGYVSHQTHSHTSILRFIELLHGLAPLTNRDANSDAMLDLFDFSCPALLFPPEAASVGVAHGDCVPPVPAYLPIERD